MEQITFRPAFADWQSAARGALLRKIPPASLVWNETDGAQPSLDIFEDQLVVVLL